MEQPTLNFSGDNDSWFDLWHIHTDIKGNGNTDFVTRLTLLDKLLQEYKSINANWKNIPTPIKYLLL